MRTTKREMKRKGFTLVELLIVIVVIGVLSAMMMLSSTEAVSSAKASDIVSDLRNLKTAALAWYADNLDLVDGNATVDGVTWGSNGIGDATVKTAILKYMSNENISDKYKFVGKDAETWFVYYDDSSMGEKISEKLAARAKSTGLLKSNTKPTTAAPNVYETQTKDYKVYMFIR